MNPKTACRKPQKHFEELTRAAIQTYLFWGKELCSQPWWNKSHANRYALLMRLEKEFGQKSYLKKLQKTAE